MKIEDVVLLLEATAHEKRLQILRALSNESKTTSELARIADMTPSIASRQLQKLVDYRLVECRKPRSGKGREYTYALATGAMRTHLNIILGMVDEAIGPQSRRPDE